LIKIDATLVESDHNIAPLNLGKHTSNVRQSQVLCQLFSCPSIHTSMYVSAVWFVFDLSRLQRKFAYSCKRIWDVPSGPNATR